MSSPDPLKRKTTRYLDAQAPETDKRTAQGAHIALLSEVEVAQRSAHIPLYARMKRFERGDDLIRQFHPAIAPESW